MMRSPKLDLRDHGMSPQKDTGIPNLVSLQNDNLQAAVGVAQMRKFDWIIQEKDNCRLVYYYYRKGTRLTLPQINTGQIMYLVIYYSYRRGKIWGISFRLSNDFETNGTYATSFYQCIRNRFT